MSDGVSGLYLAYDISLVSCCTAAERVDPTVYQISIFFLSISSTSACSICCLLAHLIVSPELLEYRSSISLRLVQVHELVAT